MSSLDVRGREIQDFTRVFYQARMASQLLLLDNEFCHYRIAGGSILYVGILHGGAKYSYDEKTLSSLLIGTQKTALEEGLTKDSGPQPGIENHHCSTIRFI